jgi:hypothetical protein
MPSLETYLDQLPSPNELRARLSANIRERELLRRLLKLATAKAVARQSNPSAARSRPKRKSLALTR